MTLSPGARVRRGQFRSVAAIIVLAAWGVALVGLVQRDVLRTNRQRMAELALRVNPGTFFYAMEQDSRHIGWASSTIDTLPDTSAVYLRMNDAMVLDVVLAGTTQRTTTRSEIMLTRAFGLLTFSVDVSSASGPQHVAGRVDGDSAVVFVVESGDVPSDSQRVAVQGPILLPSLVPLAAVLGDEPKVGRRVTYTTFDPATRGPRDVTVQILAESLFVVDDSARIDLDTGRWVPALRDTVRAWQLTTDGDNGFAGWIDAQGRLVESAEAAGMTLRRKAYELAFENWRLDSEARAQAEAATRGRGTGGADAGGGADVLEATALAARVARPRVQLERLRARVLSPALARFALDGGRQRFSGGIVTVLRETDAQLTAAYNVIAPTAAHRSRFRGELAAEPLLEVRASPILRAAARIRRSDGDPRIVVARLTQWVYDSIAKVASSSVPSALDILRDRRGDCNEHTQLFTALARSLGIPTRIVAGLAYVSGAFYYHAWAEVYLGDWVATDPTFGQFPADAAHLRLVMGGLERQTELRRLIGSLDIEVLEPQ